MQQQEGFKRFLPHLLVVAIFIVISCAFCFPAFQGKVLDQHDIKTWRWMAKEGQDYYEKTGEDPLWTNSMFGGMPEVMISNYSKNRWYNTIGNVIYRGNNPAMYFILAMLSFYILMCTLRINRWLGAIGAIAFAFSTYNPTIATAGHVTKLLDIIFLPMIIAGMITTYRGKFITGGALTVLALTFFLDANHLQIIYYSLFLVGAIAIAALITAFRKNQVKTWLLGSCVLLLAAGAAFLTSASSLLQSNEYAPYSIRGGNGELAASKQSGSKGLDREYAFAWSNGSGEVLSILVPNLYGGSVRENIGEDSHFGQKLSELGAPPDAVENATQRAPLYWGPQPLLTGSIYFGAVICLLFVLSLFIIRSTYKWWLVGVAALFIFISMGKNFSSFNYFMFDHFPYFNKFRSPNMALAMASLIFPMLGIWALKDIFEDKVTKEELWKKLKISLIITGGLCVVLLISTQTILDYKGARDAQMEQQYQGEVGKQLVKALREDRASAATSDAFRSLIFVLLAGGVLWAYSKNKMGKEMTIAALGILVVIDLLPVGYRYMNQSDYVDAEQYEAENFQPSPTDARILQDKDLYYRVFDLTGGDPFGDARPSYFHKSVGGYQGAKMQIYQDLIEHQLGKLNSAVLNMLNTKYIVIPGQNNQPAVELNRGALGNAWFVTDVQWAKTADEEMNALNAPPINNPMDSTAGSFNPAQTAVLRETQRSTLGNYSFGKDTAAYIRLTPDGYSPRRLKFESSNTKDGLAIFSDIYYPLGWKATIDGKETPIMRANYVLRALKVPAGKHTIEFVCEDTPALIKGQTLALIGSILVTLMLAAGIYAGLFRKGKEDAAAAAAGAAPQTASDKKK
jgi:hypothetical protein